MKKKACSVVSSSLLTLVPGTGLEPVRPQWSRDFKSLVSTNSTIWAAVSGCKDTTKIENREENGRFFVLFALSVVDYQCVSGIGCPITDEGLSCLSFRDQSHVVEIVRAVT